MWRLLEDRAAFANSHRSPFSAMSQENVHLEETILLYDKWILRPFAKLVKPPFLALRRWPGNSWQACGARQPQCQVTVGRVPTSA